MSTFSRPADWLRNLFVPSRFGWSPPSEVATEVSLIQPYDGGGYAVWPIGQWASTANLTTATGAFDVIAIDGDVLARILSVSVQLTAGVNPSVYFVVLTPSAIEIAVSGISLPPAGGQLERFELTTPILPPGHALRMRWFGGDAATAITVTSLRCEVPLGSVFYV